MSVSCHTNETGFREIVMFYQSKPLERLPRRIEFNDCFDGRPNWRPMKPRPRISMEERQLAPVRLWIQPDKNIAKQTTDVNLFRLVLSGDEDNWSVIISLMHLPHNIREERCLPIMTIRCPCKESFEGLQRMAEILVFRLLKVS